MSAKKITVVGAGHVGATCSQLLAMKELAREVILVDIAEGIPMGKGLDQWESAPIEGFDSQVKGANDYSMSEGSEIFIVTAGLARKPGMSRDDLQSKNAGIVKSCVEGVMAHSPDAILVLVSNPLDVMCYVAKVVSGLPRERVVGMAGILDTARFRSFIAMELGVSVESISALVLGGHGDAMVPLPRLATVGGIPLPELIPQDRIDALVERTAKGGGEIVALLKTGSAYYAPAAAAVEMVESILHDKKKILPCAAWLEGEYGLKGCFSGVPVMLGSKGIEKVYEVKLNDKEMGMLKTSADAVKEQQDKLEIGVPAT